jgi:hypothetical protein
MIKANEGAQSDCQIVIFKFDCTIGNTHNKENAKRLS